MKPLLGFSHPSHVLWAADQEQPREYFLDEGAGLRKRQARTLAWTHPLGLEKRIRHGADRHVMLPAGVRPTLEMIETQFGFEILVVLLDGPPLMGQPDQLRERGGRREGHQVVAAPAGGQALTDPMRPADLSSMPGEAGGVAADRELVPARRR